MVGLATVSSKSTAPDRYSWLFFGLFVFTKISCNLLGFLGSSEDQTTPMVVTAFKGLKVVDVACGSGDAQTLAVTENGKDASCGWLKMLELKSRN